MFHYSFFFLITVILITIFPLRAFLFHVVLFLFVLKCLNKAFLWLSNGRGKGIFFVFFFLSNNFNRTYQSNFFFLLTGKKIYGGGGPRG